MEQAKMIPDTTTPERIHMLDQALALIAITDGPDKARLIAVAVETWLELARPVQGALLESMADAAARL